MNNNKVKNEKSYIKIIDETTTEDYLKLQNSNDILGYFLLFGLIIMKDLFCFSITVWFLQKNHKLKGLLMNWFFFFRK